MAEQLSNSIDVTKLYDYAKELADLYRQEIQNADAKASGQLYNFQYRIEYQNDVFKVLFSLPDYWYWLEYGRNPTQKSEGGKLYQAIRQWIDQKGLVPKDGKSRDSLAWAITKTIHREGYFKPNHHGKHLLQNALDKAKSTGVIDRLMGSVTDDYNQQIRVDLSDLNNRKKG